MHAQRFTYKTCSLQQFYNKKKLKIIEISNNKGTVIHIHNSEIQCVSESLNFQKISYCLSFLVEESMFEPVGQFIWREEGPEFWDVTGGGGLVLNGESNCCT